VFSSELSGDFAGPSLVGRSAGASWIGSRVPEARGGRAGRLLELEPDIHRLMCPPDLEHPMG